MNTMTFNASMYLYWEAPREHDLNKVYMIKAAMKSPSGRSNSIIKSVEFKNIGDVENALGELAKEMFRHRHESQTWSCDCGQEYQVTDAGKMVKK